MSTKDYSSHRAAAHSVTRLGTRVKFSLDNRSTFPIRAYALFYVPFKKYITERHRVQLWSTPSLPRHSDIWEFKLSNLVYLYSFHPGLLDSCGLHKDSLVKQTCPISLPRSPCYSPLMNTDKRSPKSMSNGTRIFQSLVGGNYMLGLS